MPTTRPLSPFQLLIKTFDEDHFVPLAYPEGTTLDDLLGVAEQYVAEGTAQIARVVNTDTNKTVAELGWARYIK